MSKETVEDREVTAEELARLPSFYHPSLSPEGDRIAYYYDGTGRNELHLLDVESGERRQLSDGDVPRDARWGIEWGGSGDRVYFHQDEGGNEQNDVYAIDLDGNVEEVVAVDGQAIIHDSSDDGRSLLYGSDEREQMNLYRYDVESGETEQLTTYEQPVWAAEFGPDGERVAYLANESDHMENRDTYVMNADGSGKRKLDVGTEGTEAAPSGWHPEEDVLLVTDNSQDLSRVGAYDLADDSVEWFGAGEYEESGGGFTPEGDGVLVTRQVEATATPIRYDRETGEETAFDLPAGVAGVGGHDSFIDDTTVVLSHSTPTERETLLAYDIADRASETLIEPEYDDVDPDVFVDAEYVTYESEDGLEIGALLYDSGERPSPAVVMVHGGPHGQSMRAFQLYAQFLATRGYTVLQPNYRGSTGRGREFKNRIHDDWGGMEQADVAAGGRWLTERDWIDEDRVAVFGGSYGGYSAYMQLVTYPDLWTTGIAWIGITDLLALYEESMPHFKTVLERQMGDPEENEELWRERSPITHVDEMKAPVFVIHGVNDPRCPISQARRFRDALEGRGWEEGEDFEYEELGEEGHGSTDIDQKIRAFTLLGEYLDRRL